MGLIKEPEIIDFQVIDKPWSNEEKKEFSALIKLLKEQHKKVNKTILTKKARKVTV